MQNNFDILYKLRSVIRNDIGIGNDAQIIEQVAWILFLRVYDQKTIENAELSVIPSALTFKQLTNSNFTAEELVSFVDNEMLPRLSRLERCEIEGTYEHAISTFFSLSHNYMKNGILLLQVIEFVNEIQSNSFNVLFDGIIEMLRCSSDLGSQHTPRAISDFAAKMLSPNIYDSVADFSFGTGGFLVSFSNEIKTNYITDEFKGEVYGVDVSRLAFLLGMVNLLIHDIDIASIYHKDAFMIDDDKKYDVIMMNPPMGKRVNKDIASSFSPNLVGGDSSDMFLTIAMNRLKKNGRAAVVVPDGFLKGTGRARTAVKNRLFNEFNVHTIVRIPEGAFSPFTTISTSIIFFDNTCSTNKTWFYQIGAPNVGKRLGKTTPITDDYFVAATQWWNKRHEIVQNGHTLACCCGIQEIINKAYDINICGYEADKKLSPYKGKDKYIFISYSHKDKDKVFDIIKKLVNDGHNIWYDEGIDPGTEWDENIATHIEGCDGFIAFVSENYVSSDNCKDELNFARDLEKDRLLIYLENVKLPAGMAMRLNRLQAIHSYTYSDRRDFFAKLKETPMLMRN